MTVTVRDTDRGFAARVAHLRAAERDVKAWEVVVGVLADTKGNADHAGGDFTVLDVATVHEFGSPAAGIPQRSFIRAWVDRNLATIRDWQRALFQRIVAGKLTVRQALELLGAQVAGAIQAFIATSIPPPNAPETVERKGSSTTLIDSGQLRASITWHVRPKAGAT
jgi:hypothetical protein